MSHFNRRYLCYHGDQYTFLRHIMPESQVNLPLDQRPTIKGCNKKDERDLNFIVNQEKVMGGTLNARGKAPYQFYANAVDAESVLRTLNEPLNDCSEKRYKPSMNSSLFKVNTLPQKGSPPIYEEINSPASCIVPSEQKGPCPLHLQYQTQFNDGKFNNCTRYSKYKYDENM